MSGIGKYNKRVEIQAATLVQDTFGQPISTWATAATRWAAIEPLTGRELEVAKQVQAEVTHRIRLRYYSGLTPKHRFKFGSRIFSIVAVVNPDEANVEHVATCIEVA